MEKHEFVAPAYSFGAPLQSQHDAITVCYRHRTALLPAPSEAELAECVKRKASITKKAGQQLKQKQQHK